MYRLAKQKNVCNYFVLKEIPLNLWRVSALGAHDSIIFISKHDTPLMGLSFLRTQKQSLFCEVIAVCG